MPVQKIYTSLLVAELTAAEDWYAKLLQRGPDYRPMESLIQWEFVEQAGLMISTSEEIAAKGAMFLYVDDVVNERRRLQGVGIGLFRQHDRERRFRSRDRMSRICA